MLISPYFIWEILLCRLIWERSAIELLDFEEFIYDFDHFIQCSNAQDCEIFLEKILYCILTSSIRDFASNRWRFFAIDDSLLSVKTETFKLWHSAFLRQFHTKLNIAYCYFLLDYVDPIWSTFSQSEIEMLENVEIRFTRIAFRKISPSQ